MKITLIIIIITFIFLIKQIHCNYEDVFNSYIELYKKNYKDNLQEKYSNFIENIEKVNQHNQNNFKYYTITYDDNDNEIVNSNIQSIGTRKLQSLNDLTIGETMKLTFPSNDIPSLTLNEFSDLSHDEFIDMYTGFDGNGIENVVVDGNGGLNNGEISGIAIGSFIGGVSVLVASIFGYKKYKQSKQVKQQNQLELQQKEFEDGIKKIFGGVNVFDLKPGSHQSITARSCPIELNDQ